MSLRALSWDGGVLRWRAAPDASMTLRVDDMEFATLRSDAAGDGSFAFPFSPSGHTRWNVQLSVDGAAYGAVSVELGQAGLRSAGAVVPTIYLSADETVEAGLALREFQREVVIVVPVYNAPDAVRACLDSVLATTHGPYRLIVIDDGSPDPDIAALLATYADRATLLRNDANRGFTVTANRGIASADGADVVLLNADTEVAENWLAGLRRAAYSRADTGSATAVSDNAGAFSVPELEQENTWPPNWSFADAARALRQSAGTAYPRLPTGNGFCMYLRREAIAEVGVLDEAAFPQGYGEENDWSQRAAAAGWRHTIAGNVLVKHARSASFGHERRRALGEAGMDVLRARWPRYESDVGQTLFSFERRVLAWRVRRAYALPQSPLPRHLHFGDAASSGNAWRIRREPESLRLEHFDATWIELDRLVLPGVTAVPTQHAIEDAVALWLQRHAIESVSGDAAMLGPRIDDIVAALGIGRR